MFIGKCYTNGYGRAEHLEKILSDHFRTYPKSEQEYLLRCYDEYMIMHMIRNWSTMKNPSSEIIQFLYAKIKFRKVMFLNIGFNEKEYKWKLMNPVFNEIFTTSDGAKICEMIKTLPEELQSNILTFAEVVKVLKQTKVK